MLSHKALYLDPPSPFVCTCSIFVTPSPLPFEHSKLNLNPPPTHQPPIPLPSSPPPLTEILQFYSFVACCNQPLADTIKKCSYLHYVLLYTYEKKRKCYNDQDGCF